MDGDSEEKNHGDDGENEIVSVVENFFSSCPDKFRPSTCFNQLVDGRDGSGHDGGV